MPSRSMVSNEKQSKKTKSGEETLNSETGFRLLFEQSPFSIQIFKPNGDTIKVNKAWEELWGATWSRLESYNILQDKQLKEKGIMELIKKAFAGTAVVLPVIMYESPKTVNVKGVVPFKWVGAYMYPVKDSRGKVQEVVLVHEDVTEKIERGKELVKSRRHLKAILRNVAEAITVQSKDGNLIYANDAAARLVGFSGAKEMVLASKKGLLSKHLERFVMLDKYGKPFPLEKLPGRRVLAGEKNPKAIIQYLDKTTSKTQWSMVKAKPILSKAGRVEYAVNIISDITNQKHAEDTLRFKANASRLLSSSLNYQKILKTLGRIAVPDFADWFVLDMVNEKGEIQTESIVHKDEKKVKWAYEYKKKFPVDLKSETGVAHVLKTGKPEYYPAITEEMLKASIKDKEHLKLLKKVGFTSVITIPLVVNSKPKGVITFVTTESKRKFTKTDFEIAQQVGTRVSMAIQNSLLYEEVNRERERLEEIITNVPGVVWEAYGKPNAGNQIITYVSSFAKKLLGYGVEDWLTKPNFWLKIVHPEDRERAAKESLLIYETGEGGVSRFRWVKKGGGYVWIEAQSKVIKGKGGEIIGLRGVSMDVSEREEMERRKDEFISMVSHELRTPITTLKIYNKLLRDLPPRRSLETTRSYLNKMDLQLQRLNDIVTQLLNVSAIRTKGLRLDENYFSLQELIETSIKDLQAKSKKRKIVLKGTVKDMIWGDKIHIRQVIGSLISNALKYSPRGDNIVVSVKPRNGSVVVSVEDHGFGIEKRYQEKIFERFYRVYDRIERTYPGLGMGLYISKEIVKKHGGDIWLKSRPGKGSTFYFSLPFNGNRNYRKN